jgi:hypothetical protein
MTPEEATKIEALVNGRRLTTEELQIFMVTTGNDLMALLYALSGYNAVQLAALLPYTAALINKAVGRPGVMSKEVFMQACGNAYESVEAFINGNPDVKQEMDDMHARALAEERNNAN